MLEIKMELKAIRQVVVKDGVGEKTLDLFQRLQLGRILKNQNCPI